MRAATLLLCTATWLTLAACGDDANAPATDALGPDVLTPDGSGSDTAAPADTLTPPADTQSPPDDTLAPPDDTQAPPADTLTPPDDTSAPPTDTTSPPDDTLSPPDDTLSPPDDTLSPPDDTSAPPTDTVDPGPVGVNVLAHGSFEQWAAGLPVGWYGEASNLATDGVVEETAAAHDGVRACRLVQPAEAHKRFSTAPLDLAAGRYRCRYWVRGAGEVRNARFVGDYSSYSAYTVVDTAAWQPIDYTFNLAADADAFELIFSVRLTAADGLLLDDVRCVRDDEPCDAVTCAPHQLCDNATASCVTAPGFCADADDCASWQLCGADHRCALAPGACTKTSDCAGGATPVCDLATHLCVAGDPCAGVTCLDWQACDPANASCVTAEGSCASLADCDQALPVCDLASHACAPVDAAANVVPNGGFEDWDLYSIGGPSEHLLPDGWYGVCDGCSPYWPTTEIAPANVQPYTTSTHSGTTALQLIDPVAPAERFVTDPFPVVAGVTYQCAYWVRGHGTFRQRGYCGGWNTDTAFTAIDSDSWQQVTFTLGGNVNWCVIVLYASNTVADRDHLQFDDFVCIRP